MIAARRSSLSLCQNCWKYIVKSCKRQYLQTRTPSSLLQYGSFAENGSFVWNAAANFTTATRYCSQKNEDDVKLNIEENPYFDKYKRKIQDLKKSSPDVYQEKVEEIEEEMRKDRAFLKEQIEKAEAEAKAKGKSPKTLDSIMKMELVKDKSAEEIEEIWKEYHGKKDCVYAVMKAIDYDDLMEKARVCPSFLYPLPRQDGYEFFFSMVEGKGVYYTPLIMYQQMQENAPPCLTLTHFTEFKQEKDIVLMTGQYDNKLLKRHEALNLVRQMTLYYSRRSAERFNLVRIFNHSPKDFNPLDVVNEYQEMMKFLESA